MENYQQAYARRECRSKRFQLYVIDDWPLKQVMSASDPSRSASESQKTIHQWKGWLQRERIFKTLNKEEAVLLKRELNESASRLGRESGIWECLVVAGNELLLNNEDINKAYARMKDPEKVLRKPTRRTLSIIRLPSDLHVLREPETFRNFQRLLFNTCVHFESSFEADLWAPDERGIHARSPKLRDELKVLSAMHNQFVEGLKQFQLGNASKGWAMIRRTFQLNGRVVQVQHHRLFPDLLGILLLLQQRRHAAAPRLDEILRRDLALFARALLLENDPRRLFFEFNMLVPLESIHHLYLTFDSHCRDLWRSKIKGNEIESYYSYNQASFPRADRGNFYSLYEKKTVREVCDILSSADNQFGRYSTETFCLWHTALQYFFSTEKYEDMAYVSGSLCIRLGQFKERWDHAQPQQLNHDAAMTFYLHGKAEDARGNLLAAIDAFCQCVKLRSQVVLCEEWDPLKGIALRQLETIASRVGDVIGIMFYEELLNTMYSGLEARDLEEIANILNYPLVS